MSTVLVSLAQAFRSFVVGRTIHDDLKRQNRENDIPTPTFSFKNFCINTALIHRAAFATFCPCLQHLVYK